jgi:hypothetical protein
MGISGGIECIQRQEDVMIFKEAVDKIKRNCNRSIDCIVYKRKSEWIVIPERTLSYTRRYGPGCWFYGWPGERKEAISSVLRVYESMGAFIPNTPLSASRRLVQEEAFSNIRKIEERVRGQTAEKRWATKRPRKRRRK